MEQYISKSAILAEIWKRRNKHFNFGGSPSSEYCHEDDEIIGIINTLEVKEIDNTPNIKFPHYKSIVEKVFGAGNLESFEYDEAEQLVSLAKEELLKDLEVKEVDLEKEFDSFAYTLPRSAIGDGPFDKHFDDPKIIEARNHGWRHLWSYKQALKIARYFFELGLKAQKEKYD